MNWISVKDRLPEQKNYGNFESGISKPLIVWVVDPSNHYGERYRETYYCNDEWVGVNEDHVVTHWILQKDFNEAVKPLNASNK